jgi:hypothetical protein
MFTFDPTDEVDFRLSWPTLHMRYYGGLTDREIAEELGVSLRTVGYRIARKKRISGGPWGSAVRQSGGILPPRCMFCPDSSEYLVVGQNRAGQPESGPRLQARLQCSLN